MRQDLESPPSIPIASAPRSRLATRPLVHLGLFLLTVVTTLIAGSLFHTDTPDRPWEEILRNPALWLAGVPYCFSVLAILLAHELGHYLACRHYGIDASLPYFIPGVPILGTFGAFIRIRGRITHRKALFDIGVAGPIA